MRVDRGEPTAIAHGDVGAAHWTLDVIRPLKQDGHCSHGIRGESNGNGPGLGYVYICVSYVYVRAHAV